MKYFWPILAVIATNTAVLALGYYVLNIRDLDSGNMMMLRIIAILASLIAFFYVDQLVKKHDEKKKAEREKRQKEVMNAIDAMTVGIFFRESDIIDVEFVEGGEVAVYENSSVIRLEAKDDDEHGEQ